MEQLAWTNGDKPERSYKTDKPNIDKTSDTDIKDKVSDVELCAVSNIVSRTETNTNKLVYSTQVEKSPILVEPEPGDYALSRDTFRKTSNRRESSNNKLSERYMVSRACGNPFLTHLNYTDDILTQEQFLMPKNSNMEDENENDIY